MPEAAPLIKIPEEWLAWLSSFSREENGAWIVLLLGIIFLGIGIRGLWTGSIWETFTPPGFDGWLWWGRSDPDHYDRDTNTFEFWLTFIVVTLAGIGMIFMSLKMFGILHWHF